MSINEKKINNNKESNIEKDIKTHFFSFSLEVNLSNNKNINEIKQESLSEEPNSKINNLSNDVNKISTNFSTTFQTFSPCKKEYNNNENENAILGEKIKEIYQDSFNNEDFF